MRIFVFVIIAFIFNACVHDYQYKRIEPYYILNDNSSKVWLIDQMYKNNKNHAPLSLKYKTLIVFHDSRNCFLYQVQDLGENPGKKATYSLDITKKELEFTFKDGTWRFKIDVLNEKQLLLSPLKDSKNQFKLNLICFPEF